MKVSICIPTYNQDQYLEKAVRSAFEQSLMPAEIIVSDDCSTDSTSDVLFKLSKEIEILRVIRQPVNVGIALNTDACLRCAAGDFIVRLDSDDYLGPDYIKALASALMENEGAGYAHGDVQEVDEHGNFLRKRILMRKPGFQDAAVALRSAVKGYRVAANIIMFKRVALEKVNYLTGRPDYVEDYHLSASLASANFGNVYVDKMLSFYRVWVDKAKVRQRRKMKEIVGLYKVFEEVIEPAYKERGWSLSKVYKQRTSFACRQSDCLSWTVYTSSEKNELAQALRQLSSSPVANFYRTLYSTGFGNFLNSYSALVSAVKSKLKNILVSRKIKLNSE